jgi:hypothetical protein
LAISPDATRPASLSITFLGFALAAFALFGVAEMHTPSPLIQLSLIRGSRLIAGLASTALVSSVVMATLVVGPFYLARGEGLNAAATGMVMSVGPAIAALGGFPAGWLVDRRGPFAAIVASLAALMLGTILMTSLPHIWGVGGYVAALVVLTASYALFQAANNTAVMNAAGAGERGVTSALLGLSRNLGLITGASAMGAIFAWASGATSGGNGAQAGLAATFGVAALLAAVALGATLLGWQRG